MELNPDLFTLTHEELNRFGATNLTYGSLSTKGLQTLVETISLYIKPFHIEGMDLGCGDGELIYHLGIMLEGSQWYGVEICGSRVAKQKHSVFIWEGDFLEEDLRVYNVLHADNLCLEDTIAERLETKIAREFRGLYISYRKPSTLYFLQKAIFLRSVLTETTWTTHPIHYYWLP